MAFDIEREPPTRRKTRDPNPRGGLDSTAALSQKAAHKLSEIGPSVSHSTEQGADFAHKSRVSEQTSAQQPIKRLNLSAHSDLSVGETLVSEGNRRRQSSPLVQALAVEVISRLAISSTFHGSNPGIVTAKLYSEQTKTLGRLALINDMVSAYRLVSEILDSGCSIDDLMLGDISDAARYLGQLWCDDEISFFETTLGSSRLQKLAREISAAADVQTGRPVTPYRILLAPVPGEQHVFGLCILEHFFRQAGWDVWYMAMTTREELIDLVGTEFFSVVGLTMSSDALLQRAAVNIRLMRRVSVNPNLGVLVGGSMFNDQADLVTRVGADASASDGRQAVRQASKVLSLVNGHAISQTTLSLVEAQS